MKAPFRTAHLIFVVATFSIASPPARSQDLPTNQLENHADEVRQDSLLRSTLRSGQTRDAKRTRRATPSQAAGCAKKAQFRSEYGADHPKVKKLYELCRNVGL